MKIVVLLSAGIHPVSRRACPVQVEAQAIGLAGIGASVTGLHAGQVDAALGDYLGHGLAEITLLELPEGADPTEALVVELTALKPDLVLAGRRGQGGEDSGLLPYLIAQRLGWPIVADASGLDPVEGSLEVEQALPRGERRHVQVALPAVVTVHSSAPPPRPFTYAAVRRGRIVTKPGIASPVETRAVEEQSYRRRPRLIRKAKGGGGEVLVDPPVDVAAAKIIEFLEQVGVLEK
jgi:electron transfer flavoprotein beta subunit